MNRFWTYIIYSVFILLGAVSCSDEIDIPTPTNPDSQDMENCINLTLTCSKAITRAEDNPIEDGIVNFNENKIENVTVFLSSIAGDRTDDIAPVYRQTFTFSRAYQDKVTLRIPLDQNLINTLFNENESFKCRAFAAVNINVADAENAQTINDLRNLVITSSFENKQIQDRFAMYGDCEVNYTTLGNHAVGNIDVNRTAAKIELSLDVDSKIEEETATGIVTWVPDLTKMSVRLQEGVSRSSLEPGRLTLTEDDYFNTPYNLNYGFTLNEESGLKYNREQSIPFYTYPHKWTDSENERHGTFLILTVPWSPDGGNSWRTCYYHVPILPTDKFEIIRNHSYHIRLHVGMLGSFVPEVPMEITGAYYIAPWGEEEGMDVEISDYRYLVVDQNVFTVNNETDISIPFYTSHETVVTDVKMTFYRYNFSDQGSEFAVKVSMDQNAASEAKGEAVYECDFDNTSNTLNLSHILKIWVPYNDADQPVSLTTNINGTRDKLDNEAAIQAVLNTIKYFQQSTDQYNDEYSRIEYEVTVQHKDVFEGNHISPNLFKETVKITQFPGMYITAVQNYAELLGTRPSNPTASNQYAWSSGAQGSTMISGRYSVGNTYDVINNPSFWRSAWIWNPTDSQTKPNGIPGLTSNAIPDYSEWSQNARNDYYIAYNAYNWNYSLGLDADYGNWNPNMYLVTVTQLPKDTKYIIDDPRSYYVNNFLSNDNVDARNTTVWNGDYYYFQKDNGKGPESDPGYFGVSKNPVNEHKAFGQAWWMEFVVPGFITAPAVEGGSRKLQNYYPTREDETTSDIIAPKFRICSSYGGSSAFMTRVMSRRRAAAYQEMGYYAGRWRLPTYAEVRYMIDLAAQEKIPRLFGSTSTSRWIYWCAQGAVSVPGKTEADQSVYIDPNPVAGGSGRYSAGDLFTGNNYRDHTRFVYDEWYWGETTLQPSGPVTTATTTPVYTFTWGDRPKTNPEN